MGHCRYIKNEYNEDDKTSFVEKGSPYGVVKGATVCYPEDEDIMNRWDGMYIADFYCDRQIQKMRSMDMESRYKGVKHVYNVLSEIYGKDNEVVKKLQRQVWTARNIADKESEKYRKMKTNGYNIISGIIDVRRDFREKHPVKE